MKPPNPPKRPDEPAEPSAESLRQDIPTSAVRVAAAPRPVVAHLSDPDIRVPKPEGAEPLWGGRIRVLEEVGRGAMGTVLRGVDTKLGRELALKVTSRPRDKMPRELLARFVEEAQITAQLEHPNVVPIHDLGLDPEGRAYFSMKLIRGQSLESILDKRAGGDPATLAEFGLRRLLDVFLQVCQAIAYAHARGVIHRDLKPANIMVGDFGEVLVMDWGVAKLRDAPAKRAPFATEPELSPPEPPSEPEASRPPASMPSLTSIRARTKAWETQLGEIIGTPAYMAPEQARGEAVDERSDIYSLGVILYEILCGTVPFDDEPQQLMARLLTEEPRAPSEINRATPPGLEALTLRLLAKDPERRITIRQIRAQVRDYIEGTGHGHRRESLFTSALWSAGALLLFAFLVWYLTGQSAAKVLTFAPPAVLNAVGWFLLVLAVGYPLWAAVKAVRLGRREPDRFRPPQEEELFVSGFLAHRTFSAALAPLFQLVFVVELVTLAIAQATLGGVRSDELVNRISHQMRAEWSEALIVILVFLFAYLFFLAGEVRFARRIDRYDLVVRRPSWELAWPIFLIVVLLATVVTTAVLDWALTSGGPSARDFIDQQVLMQPLNLIEIVKTLVFQSTFLLGVSVTAMLVSFPMSELLAALRLGNQLADEASVTSRSEYFMRSVATFRVARAFWLYGAVMIASLSAITMLADRAERPLVERILYIIGPSLIGFLGSSALARSMRRYLSSAPAVERLLQERTRAARRAQWHASISELGRAPWRWRLLQLAVPVVCILGYLLWTGSGIQQQAIRELILPVTTKDWLLILPYALILPLLLVRDFAQIQLLKRRVTRKDTET